MNIRSVVKKIVPKQAFKAIEPYGHLGEAMLLGAVNGFPAKGLKVIGVTGTNGKTSTAFLIHRMLHEAGYKVGLMTTVAYGTGLDIKAQGVHMTTLPVPLLLKRMKAMKEQGMEWLVLEVTSHALAQNRVWGIPFELAVMTNITHEHLDYHGTFDRYLEAKTRLFKLANQNKKGLRVGIVNAEDEHAANFARCVANPVSYGVGKGDFQAKNVKLSGSGSDFDAVRGDKTYHIHCNLTGSFNISNSLAAVAVGEAIGLNKKQIEQGIAALTGVDGRMARIDEGQDFDVIVDYAHTPDSFEKIFKDFKPVTKGKLVSLFGSPGRRDEAKRAVQGALAGKYTDVVIVTEDDERDMDRDEIIEQIAKGAESEGKQRNKDLFLIRDRIEAIDFAIKNAKKGDVILLLSKGHEKGILRNGPRAAELRHLKQDDSNPDRVVIDPWNESEIARTAIRKYHSNLKK